MATKTQQSSIQSAAIYRVTDKLTHEKFYLVKSDSEPNTFYEVRWNSARLMWCCNCPAMCSGCKHTRAVNEVLKIRRAAIAAQIGGDTVAIVARLQAEEERRYRAPLNSANRELRMENGAPMR